MSRGYLFLRRSAVGLCILAALLCLAVVAAQRYLGSSLFQTHVQALVNKEINGTLSWKSLDFSIFQGRAAVRELKLRGPDGKTVAEIPFLEAALDWTGFRNRELKFSSVRAQAPQLFIKKSREGEFNLLAALGREADTGDDAGKSPFNLIILDLRILDGRLALSSPDLNLTLNEVSVRLSRLDLDQGILSGLEANAGAPGMALALRGGISNFLETPVLNIQGNLKAETPGIFPASGIDGSTVLNFSMDGTLENPRAEIFAAFGPGTLRGQPINSVRLSARLEDRVVTLNPSQIDPGTGPVHIRGRIDLAGMFPHGFTGEAAGPESVSYALSVRQDSLDLAWMLTLLNAPVPDKISGTLSPVLTITGRGIIPGSIQADLEAGIKASGLQFPGLAVPADISIQSSARLEDNGLTLDNIRITGPGISGSGGARLDLPRLDPAAATLDAGLSLSLPDLSLPAEHLDLQASGSAVLDLRAEGPLLSPVLWAALEGRDLSIMDIRADALTLESDMDAAGAFHIRNAVLTAGRGRLRAAGRIGGGPDYPLAVDLSIENIPLEAMVPGKELQGTISGSMVLGGTVDCPEIRARMTGEGLAVDQIPLGRVDTALSLNGNRLSIDRAQAALGSSRLSASGTLDLANQALDIRAAAPELNLADLPATGKSVAGNAAVDLTIKGTLSDPEVDGRIEASHLQTPDFPEIYGDLSAALQLRGALDSPEDIRAGLRISMLSLSRDNRPLAAVKDADLVLESGWLRLENTPVLILDRGRMTLDGRLSLDGELTASAGGTFPLAMAASFAEGIRSADGDIDVSLRVRGSVSTPEIQGDLSFSDLTLGLDDLEQPLRNITGRLGFSPQGVRIDQMTGRLGDGDFQVTGTSTLAGGRPGQFTLSMEARQVSLDLPDTLSLALNGRLTLSGTPEESRLAGKIDILEGRYYRDVDLSLINIAASSTRKVRSTPAETRPEFLKTIDVAVDVSRRDPLLIDNNLAYLTVSPDITIRGTAHSPVLSGQARVEEGTISFQSVTFDVTSGTVDFINPYAIEPEISITGETVIRSWTITVEVSGTPEDLKLNFSSDPSETDADILSLIAFGKTTREMGTAQGSGQLAAAGAAAGLVAGPLGKKIKEATGLDEVDISMDDSDGTTGVRISLGVDLSRQLSLAYGVDIRDGETVQQVTTYYKLLEHLLMSGFQDTGGRFGGGLKYRLEFR